MSTLAELLVKNQNNLDRMRARLRYLRLEMADYERDIHRQYGPQCEHWTLWYDSVLEGRREVYANVVSTKQFVDQLRDFVDVNERRGSHTPSVRYTKSMNTMCALAHEMCECEANILHRIDERISLLRTTADQIRCAEFEEE
jgi:hypothetical protein